MQDQSRTVAVGVWFGRVAGRFEEREDDWYTVAGHGRLRGSIVTEYVCATEEMEDQLVGSILE